MTLISKLLGLVITKQKKTICHYIDPQLNLLAFLARSIDEESDHEFLK